MRRKGAYADFLDDCGRVNEADSIRQSMTGSDSYAL
jgi:hypothetical protein